MKDEKLCENCRYYLAHYIKRNTSYININSGHCTHSNNRCKKKEVEVCQHWKDMAYKKEERRKTIKQTLENMSKRLDEIALVLKDDID